MAEKTVIAAEIKVDSVGAAKAVLDLKKEVEKLNEEFKKTEDGSEDQALAFLKLKKAQEDLLNANKKLSTGFKENSKNSFDLKSNITDLSPAANAASEATAKFNQVLNVIRANPIIAVVTALVGILIAVGKYMAGVDGAADAMSRSWASLSTLLSAFMDKVLSPLIDGFVWLIDGLTKLGTLIGDTFSPGLKAAADRAGELRDELNDLEDAQKNNAIATAEANLRLAEARDIAMDATKPIKERVKALKEAAKIEKEQADEVYKTNLAIYRNRVEQMGIEMNVRKDLLDTIRNGSIEQLKAARVELLAMKNVNGDKLLELDRYLTEAINSQSASSKIQTKTEKQVTAMEKEEADKRDAARKESAAKRKAQIEKENEEKLRLEKEYQQKQKDLLVAGERAIQDALKVLRVDDRKTNLAELKKKFDEDIAAATAAGLSTLKISEAYRKQRDDINFKFDEQERVKRETEEKGKQERLDAMQLRAVTSLQDNLKKQKDLQEQAAKDKIALDTYLLEQQKAMQQQVLGLLENASVVFGKETAVGKGIAIAQALINTYMGATDALRAKSTLPSPFDVVAKVVNVAAVLATGFKAVKAITAVQVPGGGGSGGGSTGSLSVSAPVMPQAATTTLNQGQINQIGNTAARAFVLETDVSGNQERVRRLNRAARIN